MRRIIAFVTTLVLILASTISAFGAGYMDVKQGNWAYDAVNTMSEKAIIKGYPDGSFKPNNTVTYGEFIKMALIADTGEDAGNAASGHWASNYYSKALELRYFTQYDIGKSRLNDEIIRSDMALIISAILGDVRIENYDKIQEGIEDITYKTPHEYDITKAYSTGILTGYTDNTFRPEKTLSRAESATVIYRLVDESKRVLPGENQGNPEPEKETISVTYGTKTLTYTVEEVQLGYNGIQRIEVVPQNGRIAIYSTVKYDAILVFIGNQSVDMMGFTSGKNYYIKDGYYVYLADPADDNIVTSGKCPSLAPVTDGTKQIETIYKFKDVTL